MTNLLRLSALLAAMSCAAPAMATTAECAKFELIPDAGRAQYQPFESSPTIESFEIKIRRLDDGISGVRFLLVDRTPRPSGPGFGAIGPLQYDISARGGDDTRRVFVVGNEQPQPMTGAEVYFDRRAGDQIAPFRLLVPAGQEARAQIHREELVVRYQCLGRNNMPVGGTREQPASIELSLTVPRYVAAYIGSVGQTRGTIDFGNVSDASASLTKAIGITALSTLPYAIKFESENNALLKRRRGDDAGIGYAMRYAAVPVADGDTLVCPITPAPMGRAEQLEVALDPSSIAQLPAGAYEDTVTLTFTPRDVAGVTACTVRN